MSITAKLFRNGRNQAVRIPKSFAFEGIDEVTIVKDGDRLIITPARKTWTSFAELPKAGEDFMPERPDLLEPDRTGF